MLIQAVSEPLLGTGEDGAVVLFDVNGDPNDDRYFDPTAEGITLTQFENGVARVTKEGPSNHQPQHRANITMVYDQGVVETSGTEASSMPKLVL